MSDFLNKNILTPTSNFFTNLGQRMKPVGIDPKKRQSHQLKHEKTFDFEPDQEKLRFAIKEACDPYHPKRNSLLEIYRETKRDFHLLSQMRSANYSVISSGSAIVHADTLEIDKDRTRLMQRQWFEDMCNGYLDTEYEGHGLGEFGELRQTKHGWEISSFAVIPREHVLPEKGHIIGDPNAMEGLPFRGDDRIAKLVNHWLIEMGDPKNIGLLAIASKNSIYKKYGIADWARSSEKWGDPQLMFFSGSDDEKENDKKEEYLKNFGNNGYTLMDKDDKAELLERKNGNGWQIFQGFLQFLNDENSKGINGQVATADDQAWVGTAEVQQELMSEYTKARLRRLMYFMNETVIPKLVTLWNGQTAYKQLDGYLWMPLQFLEETHGKELNKDGSVKSPEGGQKPGGASNRLGKHQPTGSGYISSLDQFYASCGCDDHEQLPELQNIVDLDKAVNNAIKRVHQRKIKAGDIDNALVVETAKRVWSSVKQGFDKNLTSVKYGSPEHRLKVELRYNIHVMGAFKTHHNLLDVHDQLLDSDGKIKTESQFLKDVKPIVETYNKRYLRAERHLAKGQAAMSSKWMSYQGRGGSLVYIAVMDVRTRAEHASLDGATYPVDHSFWDIYFPKNGWGCRCSVRWISEELTKPADQRPELLEMFKSNPGKTGKIFDSSHPYFEVAQEYAQRAQDLFGYVPPVNMDRFRKNLSIYETLRDDQDYKISMTDTESGGFLAVHKKPDRKDLPGNEKAGRTLASNGYAVEVRQHIDSDDVKNPELRIGGELSDLKAPKNVAGIKTAFKNARKQQLDNLALAVNTRWKDDEIMRYLSDGFYFNQTIELVYLLRSGRVIEITRSDWQLGHIGERIKK